MNVASESPAGDSSIAAFPSIGYLSREALALATRLWQSLSLVENYCRKLWWYEPADTSFARLRICLRHMQLNLKNTLNVKSYSMLDIELWTMNCSGSDQEHTSQESLPAISTSGLALPSGASAHTWSTCAVEPDRVLNISTQVCLRGSSITQVQCSIHDRDVGAWCNCATLQACYSRWRAGTR
jgi:hypothetical protein